MNKRIVIVVLLALGALLTAGWTFGRAWLAQGDGLVLDPNHLVTKSERPDVVEFFVYNCSHCFNLEPVLERWREGNDGSVAFAQVPLVVGPAWLPFANQTWLWAKTYYSLEAMGKIGEIHSQIFAAIHVEKIDLTTADKMIGYLETLGVDAGKFRAHFDSESVLQKVMAAKRYKSDYQVRSTPTIVVNGYYRTSMRLSDFNISYLMRNVDEFVSLSTAN